MRHVVVSNLPSLQRACFALRDLFIWNDNQTGHLRVGSTNLTLNGCTGLQELDAHNNLLTSTAITFVMIGQTPHMEIQIAGGAPDRIVWHGVTGL